MDEESKYWYDRIERQLPTLKKGFVKLRRMRNQRGLCYPNNKGIEIDYRKDMLEIFVHELLHDIDFNMKEQEVVRLSRKIMNKLNNEQVIHLLRELVRLSDDK